MDKGVQTFPKDICPKENVIVQLEVEFAYYNPAVQHFSDTEVKHFAREFTFILNSVTDNTPFRESLFLLVETELDQPFLNLKFPVREKTLYEVG